MPFYIDDQNITITLSDFHAYKHNGSVIEDLVTLIYYDLNPNKDNTDIIFEPCKQYQPTYPNISSSSIDLSVISQLEIFASPGAAVDETVICHSNATSCGIKCNESVSCFLASFEIYTVEATILCESIYSCLSSTISAYRNANETGESFQLICESSASCSESMMDIDGYNYVEIECINSKACFNARITIANSIQATVRCHQLISVYSKHRAVNV